VRTPTRQSEDRKGPGIKRRFIGTVCLAAVWSIVAIAGLSLGLVLLGAAVIGMLGTIGIEPPRLRRATVADPTFI
jgi:hypothetical protein